MMRYTFQAAHAGSIPAPALKPLAAPVGVGAMPDVNDKDFMLLIVDLVQHAPISHEACAPDAIQRRA